MSSITTASIQKFHEYLDAELAFGPVHSTLTKQMKYFVIQERELSYRFYSHFHPHVGQLARRLLRSGTPGLQAADTDYTADGASLPGSIEVALNQGATVTVTAGASVRVVSDVSAPTAGGATIALTPSMQLELAGATSAVLLGPSTATLVEGMKGTPAVGSPFTLSRNEAALLLGGARLALPAATPIKLGDGRAATLPPATEVILAGGAGLTIPNGTQTVLTRRKRQPRLYADVFSPTTYKLVEQPYPIKDLDFSSSGAYSVYNWELFFHVPLTVAIHLSKNQRFADAQRWFHFLFDPTDDSEGPTPERFWKVRPFQTTDVKQIEDVLVNLATGGDEALRKETVRSIEAWQDAPFRPHVIARYRQQAYMYKTVMAYLDNLLAWGDSLFRQDTGEAIDEALMLYVLAANILGPRPETVPGKGAVRPQTYANLRNDLQDFGTAMREVEADVPFDLLPFPGEASAEGERLATVRSLGKALYFGVPRNDKLLGYWDTVADRLFKIRNSLNLQGIFRQLALFEPPIDPAVLARAAAAGLDTGAIVNGLNQPLPLVRFQVLVQKAAELAQEVKSLGSNLLSAMEKEDGEALAILRTQHERVVLELAEHVKYGQLQEAIKSKEGLLASLALAVQRYTYYERQLGKKPDEIEKAIPAPGELDAAGLETMKFAMKEPELALRDIEIDISRSLGESGGKIVSSHERTEITKLAQARDSNENASGKERIGAGLSLLPELGVAFEFWGIGGNLSFGGSALSRAMSFWAGFARADAEKQTYESGSSARVGSYGRREQDWAFQSNLAAGEIAQTFKQLRAAQLREAVAEQELKSHRKQMAHAADIEVFLNEEGTQKAGKKTNRALYTWMKREVKGLYSQCFQFAFDVAKRAERALQHELGNRDLGYLQYGYLAGKEGLLAGERLYLDIKRMELAYHELNQREYELTKHVSLLQVAPLALLSLRRRGRCTVVLPESLFDMDGPGHYFRRIRSVAVSIPCVTGPYASVNCTLSLLKSGIRKTPVLRDGVYARQDAEDDRFDDYFGSVQSIVTSSAQSDGGLFETNLRDERYLPFENAGAISEWQIELPGNPSQGDPIQFDYETIADVILHLRYTAREGGALLRQASIGNLKTSIAEARAPGSVRLFCVRSEFPNEWAKFQAHVPGNKERFLLELALRAEHYPFWSKDRLSSVTRVEMFALSSKTVTPATIDVFDKLDTTDGSAKHDTLTKDPSLGNALIGKVTNIVPAKPEGTLELFFEDRELADLWIALTWNGP
jgi:receptor-binding and translocation channel-forming TcA subunit of Tc toxin